MISLDIDNRLDFYGLSHIGWGRKNNEDFFRLLPQFQSFFLADGMGGHRAGEIAAEEAINCLSSFIEDFFLKQSLTSLDEICQSLEEIICKANDHVFQLGEKHRQYEGMGTTLCSLVFFKNRIIYGHVGDSRIYRLRKGKLTQLTHDHSLKNAMIKQGVNPEKINEKVNNILTKALGTSQQIIPEINFSNISQGDLYLICSDGLSDVLENAMIHLICSQNFSAKKIAENLIEKALIQGGKDNITAIVVKVQ